MAHIDEFTLNEYVDNAMSDEQRAEVEAHLNKCADCQAELAELQQLFFALDNVTEAPFTVDVSVAVKSQIEQEAVNSKQWSVNSGLLLVFEIVAAGVLLFFLWPTVQEWLILARGWQGQFAVDFALPKLVTWTEITSTSASSVQVIFNHFQSTPSVDLATMQWAVLLSVGLIIWLAGNRLLFTSTNESGGSHG